MEGFIQVHRKIQDSVVFQNPYYLKLWMWLLLKARFKPGAIFIGTQQVDLKTGELVWGRKEAAAELNKGITSKEKKSESTWENYLKKLEKLGKVNRRVNSKFTVVTIVNYEFYQDVESKSSQDFTQQVNSNLTEGYQQVNTNLTQKNNVISSSTTSHYINKLTNAYEAYDMAFPEKPMNQFTSQSIEGWIEDFGGQEEIICMAIKNAAEYSATNFKYVERTLTRWDKEGLRTVEDVQRFIDDFERGKEEKMDQEIQNKGPAAETEEDMKQRMQNMPKVPMHNWLEK